MPHLTTPLVLILLPLVAAGCAGKGPAYAPRAADVAGVVEMTNTFAFAPEIVTVPAGGTVEWRNASLVTHSVTADPAKMKDSEEITPPAGAQPFQSGEIGRGQVWRQTFTVPGTYRYVCSQHDWLSMAGTVEVTP